MPRSFRIDPALEARLLEVAEREGVPVSKVVREAITRYCDEVLGRDLRAELADVIGVIASDGGRADRTGEAFKKLLVDRARHQRSAR